MVELATELDLKQLPLRAILALASRTVRRIQPQYALKEDHPESETCLHAVGMAVFLAEEVARGNEVDLETVSRCEEETVRALLLAQEGAAKDKTSAFVANAAYAVINATKSVLEGQHEPESASKAEECMDSARACATAAGAIDPEGQQAALLDWETLHGLSLGTFPELGEPVDPGETGVLGPVRPRENGHEADSDDAEHRDPSTSQTAGNAHRPSPERPPGDVAELRRLQMQLEDDRAALQSEREELEKQRDKFLAKRELFQNEQKNLREELAKARDELVELEGRLHQRQEELTEQEAQLNARQEELSAQQNELDQQRAALDADRDALEQQHTQTADEESSLQQEHERIAEKERALDEATSQLEADRQDLQRQFEELEAERGRLREERESFDAERTEFVERRDQAVRDSENPQRETETLEEERQQLQQQWEELNSFQEKLQTQSEELRAAEEALQNDRHQLEEDRNKLHEHPEHVSSAEHDLDQRQDELQQQRAELEAREKQLEADWKQLEIERGELDALRQQFHAEQARSGDESHAFERSRSELDPETQQLREDRAELQEQVARLQAALNEYESRADPGGGSAIHRDGGASETGRRRAADSRRRRRSSGATSAQLRMIVVPGTANSMQLAELLHEISKLYRHIGGPGVRFEVRGIRNPVTGSGTTSGGGASTSDRVLVEMTGVPAAPPGMPLPEVDPADWGQLQSSLLMSLKMNAELTDEFEGGRAADEDNPSGTVIADAAKRAFQAYAAQHDKLSSWDARDLPIDSMRLQLQRVEERLKTLVQEQGLQIELASPREREEDEAEPPAEADTSQTTARCDAEEPHPTSPRRGRFWRILLPVAAVVVAGGLAVAFLEGRW